MKFYHLAIFVEPLAAATLPAMIREIFDRITTDGKEKYYMKAGIGAGVLWLRRFRPLRSRNV